MLLGRPGVEKKRQCSERGQDQLIYEKSTGIPGRTFLLFEMDIMDTGEQSRVVGR